MPNTKYETTNLHILLDIIKFKQNGKKYRRYSDPQFCNKDVIPLNNNIFNYNKLISIFL